MSYDTVCKYLAQEYPAAFVRWLLGIEPKRIRILKTELLFKPIQADSLFLLKMGQQILHVEFQTEPQSQPPLPLRMLDYSVRLKRKYQCRVVQVIIFLNQSNSEMCYTSEYRDDTTIHKYQVIRLWEQDPSLFLNESGLLPFAPLTKSKQPSLLLSQIAKKINTIEDSEQRKSLASCAGILAGLRFEESLINSLFREEIMKESVIYQKIIREGKQQGKKEEALTLVIRLLDLKLGEIEDEMVEKVETLSTEALEELAEALLNFKESKDLQLWLDSYQN